MALRPAPKDDDPQVTDLRRYRKAREAEKRKRPPRPPRAPGSGLLGTNRYAGLILAAIVLLVVVVYVLPLLRR